LHRAFQILERHHRIGLAGFFGTPCCTAAIMPPMRVSAAVGQFARVWRCRQSEYFSSNRRERRQRMAGDVKAQQFLFVREQFMLRPFGQAG
jgi:hypothetical protein